MKREMQSLAPEKTFELGQDTGVFIFKLRGPPAIVAMN